MACIPALGHLASGNRCGREGANLEKLFVGNDLARALGWGGSISDEPLSQTLKAVAYDTEITTMDRCVMGRKSSSFTIPLQMGTSSEAKH